MRHMRFAAVTKARRQVSALASVLAASVAFIFASSDAHAVMRGSSAGGISRHVVKLVGHNLVVHRGRDRAPATAHRQSLRRRFRPVLRDRRRQAHRCREPCAAGQTTLLTLASPLPAQYIPIATGSAGGEGTYTIAGYGTAQESARMRSAGLREARLVNDNRYNALVDPRRRGPISASACMGDSGGPVANHDGKRYVLVGIVERVSNYAGIGACGFLTHFSSVSGVSNIASAPEGTTRQVSEPRRSASPARSAASGRRARHAFVKGHGKNGAGNRAVLFSGRFSQRATHSTLMPAAFTIGHHFSISAFW